MKLTSAVMAIIFFAVSSLSLAKTQVQRQWIQAQPVSAGRAQIQICTDYECLIIGKQEGYTAEDFQGIREINAMRINAMTAQKWLVTVGVAVIGGYLFRIGKILTSVTFGAITYRPIRGYDERIMARETFQNMPNVLSNDSFELTPEQFVQLAQGLRDAVSSYDDCLEASVDLGGPADLEYCRTGQIPGQTQIPWGP